MSSRENVSQQRVLEAFDLLQLPTWLLVLKTIKVTAMESKNSHLFPNFKKGGKKKKTTTLLNTIFKGQEKWACALLHPSNKSLLKGVQARRQFFFMVVMGMPLKPAIWGLNFVLTVLASTLSCLFCMLFWILMSTVLNEPCTC